MDDVESAAVAVSPKRAAVGGAVAEDEAADVAERAVFQTYPHDAGLGEHFLSGAGGDPDAGVAGVEAVRVVLRHGDAFGIHDAAFDLIGEVRLVFGLVNGSRLALRQKITGVVAFKILLEENGGLRADISRGHSQRRQKKKDAFFHK